MKQMAQGDVLLIAVDKIPKNAVEVPRDGDRVVLAYGEVTGHSHGISDVKARMMRFNGEGFLEIGGRGATLKHEEHGEITIKPGAYRVVLQREYAYGATRQVAD